MKNIFNDDVPLNQGWFHLSINSDYPKAAELSFSGTEIASAECQTACLLEALNVKSRAFAHELDNQHYFCEVPMPISPFFACIIANLLTTLSVFDPMDPRHGMLYKSWKESDFMTRFHGGLCHIKNVLKNDTPEGIKSIHSALCDQWKIISDREFEILVVYKDLDIENDAF